MSFNSMFSSGYGNQDVKCLSPKDTHGPIVNTGPTAGQNRSRAKDGHWRRRRSDAGKKRV